MDVASIILYEDNHLLVVNKPPRILSQMDRTGDLSIIELAGQYIKEKYNKPGAVYIRAVHRIDRPVSGCLILTKTSKATERMLKIIKDRNIEKIYHVITKHRPPKTKDRLINHLVKDTFRNKVKVFDKPQEKSKEAILNYKYLQQAKNYHLLEINLETGRPHQIRVQLSNIGCPVLGDFKYKDKTKLPEKSIGLHSRQVRFIHPVLKEKIEITAPYPEFPHWQSF